ncbi:Serine/threonine-protein kinase SMG1 [Hordeum vulgare]|nr:Serine/threonine-protein kinase SMG1 [Hordeum vulgare]
MCLMLLTYDPGHGEHVADPPRSAHAISALVKNFVRARKRTTGVVRHGWQRPPDGTYKLNVDVGFSADSGRGSTGAVLRSNKGVFIAGSCSDIPFAEDASSAKVRSLRDRLILASEVGVQQLLVESDYQDVVDTMLLDGNSLGNVEKGTSKFCRGRWLWLSRTDADRAWQGLDLQFSREEIGLFHASTFMVLGDGHTALFWEDRWLHGQSIRELAPLLYLCIPQEQEKGADGGGRPRRQCLGP